MKFVLSLILLSLWLSAGASAQTPTKVLYTNDVPGLKYPIKVNLPPLIWGHATVIASVNGDAMVAGGTIMSSAGSWNLEAGNFIVGINPKGADGMHVYHVGPGIQTSAANPLLAAKHYTIAMTANGVHLSLYVCSPQCIKTWAVDKGKLLPGGAAYIGGSGPTIRICKTCHIWGVKVMTPLYDEQVQAYANAAPPDPYPEPSPSPEPTDAPTASPSPTSAPTTQPPGKYPLYSSLFTGQTPFHATVAYLTSLSGTQKLPTRSLQAFWNQTWYQSQPSHPIHYAEPRTKSYRMSCTTWGACNGNGKTVWFSTDNPTIEGNSDKHITSIDPQDGVEYDCWVGSLSGNNLNCAWGGIFPLSGSGLATDRTSSAVAAGFAVGIFTINAQDMINGLNGIPIAHALGTTARCLDNLPNGHMAYPAFTTKGSDATCSGNNGGPNGSQPAYGDLLALNMTSSQIAASSYSPACKVILNALATYGAYLMDTGGGNDNIWLEDARVYGSSNNPWYTVIETQFGSDGNGKTGPGFSFGNCMNRLSASNFSLYEIQPGAGR